MTTPEALTKNRPTSRSRNRRLPALIRAGSALAVVSMVLSACSGGASGEVSGEGKGIGPDATKEQYIEALADVQPIKLKMQLAGSPTSTASKPAQEYAKAVEEWSGGKIKFDILFAGSMVEPSRV